MDGRVGLVGLAPRILKRDFPPVFKVGLMPKDLNLVTEAAESVRIPLPATALIQQLLRSLGTASESEDGTQALARVLERLSDDQI